MMLQRHLGLPVYDDSAACLTCSHCQTNMDHLVDHSSTCKSGFGVAQRHNMVRNVFAREVFCPAGLSARLEAPLLIFGASLLPADVLTQPPTPPSGAPLGKNTTYDIIVRSPYTLYMIRRAASSAAGAATLVDAEEPRAFERAVRGRLTH